MKRTRALAAIGAVAAAALLLGPGTASAAAASPVIPTAPPVLNADGSMPNAPDGGAKKTAPETNLAKFPKLPVVRPSAAQSAAAAAAPKVAEVMTFKKKADGSVGIGLYEPHPGVTPEQLASNLRAAGDVTAVATTDTPDVAAAKAVGTPVQTSAAQTQLVQPMSAATWQNCQLGTAVTLTCAVSYWANNGLNHPNVRFNDHTSSVWPVNTAVYYANQAQGIDSTYLWDSCPFKAGARCVDVYSGDYGNTGWDGFAYLNWPNGSHTTPTGTTPPYGSGVFSEQGNYVQLNDYYSNTSQGHQHVAVHELGHVLGLGHGSGQNDVMNPSFGGADHPPLFPSSDEYALLANLYSVVH
ncbi:matrixin family metalloprotease [Pseudonocardia sp. T1-2H]|uniref:matrixin family metalloprotease n=1 Tax=Pseudonocardia sp. T1-2H TaxID=3128899 RepID=UPI003100CB6D